MDFDTRVKTAIYHWTARTTLPPTVAETAKALGETRLDVREAYRRLFRNRVLYLEPDGDTIRMAPPFSAVPTQHRVTVAGSDYFANCSWDALGIPAALHAEANIFSRCEETLEPIRLRVGPAEPDPQPVVAHFAVPAAKWWADLVYT